MSIKNKNSTGLVFCVHYDQILIPNYNAIITELQNHYKAAISAAQEVQ